MDTRDLVSQFDLKEKKTDHHFNSVLFCLGYREYLYFCAGLKLMCALGSVFAKTKAVMDSLELPGYI